MISLSLPVLYKSWCYSEVCYNEWFIIIINQKYYNEDPFAHGHDSSKASDLNICTCLHSPYLVTAVAEIIYGICALPCHCHCLTMAGA